MSNSVNWLNLKPESILKLFNEAYWNQYHETLKIGSDEHAFASTAAYVLSVLTADYNSAAGNRFLETASGAALDAIAATYGINARPEGFPATGFFRIVAGTVAEGTTYARHSLRVSDETGKYIFTNATDLEGGVVTNGVFECEVLGSEANDIPSKGISKILQAPAYVTEIYNEDYTGGGGNTMDGDDDAFRAWLKLKIQSFAGAGTAAAYNARALLADNRIIDAHTIEQDEQGYQKGKVQIYIIPDSPEALLNAQSACEDPAFRPVGDFVTVYAAEAEDVDVPKLKVSFERRFAQFAEEFVATAHKTYNQYLRGGFNRPFVYADYLAALRKADSRGVFASDAIFVGIDAAAAAPVEASAGAYLLVNAPAVEITLI